MWHIQPHLKAFLSREGLVSCHGDGLVVMASKLLSADKGHEM